MLYKQTIWYEIYRGRKIKWDSFEQYFDMNGTDESWYIYYVEEDDEPRFELHAHIEEDVVVSAEPFKADVYGGHGRPTINERSLTSSEKKYAISIFDECFIDRVGDSIRDIIDNAISSQVEYGGYKIVKSGSDHVVFISPEGSLLKAFSENLIHLLKMVTIGCEDELWNDVPGYFTLYHFTFPVTFLGIFLGTKEILKDLKIVSQLKYIML